jgi:hypothetical protein
MLRRRGAQGRNRTTDTVIFSRDIDAISLVYSQRFLRADLLQVRGQQGADLQTSTVFTCARFWTPIQSHFSTGDRRAYAGPGPADCRKGRTATGAPGKAGGSSMGFRPNCPPKAEATGSNPVGRANNFKGLVKYSCHHPTEDSPKTHQKLGGSGEESA